MKKILLVSVLCACIVGCTVGPNYHKPEVSLPEKYEEMPVQEEENINEVDLGLWWKQFNDELLDQFVCEALHNNQDWRIALERIEELRALYWIETSKLFPQIEANASAIRARRSENLSSDVIEDPTTLVEADVTNFSGPLIQNFFQVGFDAMWELDFFGKNRRSKEAAFYDFEATQERALGVRISLIAEVARSYVEIRSLQMRIQITEQQIARQKDILELASSRYHAGLTSHADVALAEASLQDRESILRPLQSGLKQTIFFLATLLGKMPENFDQEYFTSVEKVPRATGRIPADLPSKLLRRRPDVRQAERELAAATARIGVAKADLFPSFSLTGSFGVQSNNSNNLFTWPSRFWTLGPTMLWSLFDAGQIRARVRAQNARQRQALLNYEKVIINSLKDVESSLIAYAKEAERLQDIDEKLKARALVRDYALEQYLSGLVSLFRVIEEENEVFDAELQLVFSEQILMTNLISLYKALGGGWQCSCSQ